MLATPSPRSLRLSLFSSPWQPLHSSDPIKLDSLSLFLSLLPRRFQAQRKLSSPLDELRGNERELVRGNHPSTELLSLACCFPPCTLYRYPIGPFFLSRLRSAVACKTLRREMPSPRRALFHHPPNLVPARSSFFFSFPNVLLFIFPRFSSPFHHLADPSALLSPVSTRSSSATRPRGNVSSTETVASSSPLYSPRGFFFANTNRPPPVNFPRVTNIEKYPRRSRNGNLPSTR